MPVTIDDVRPFALSLERAYEALVRDRVKFRVGRIVFVAWGHANWARPSQEIWADLAAEKERQMGAR